MSHRRSGSVLGLLMLETHFPRPPGDIGHPLTFGFEVRRRVVQGATPERVVRGSDPAAAAALHPSSDATGGRGLRCHIHKLRLPGALAARAAGRVAGAGVELGAAAAGRAAGPGQMLRRHHDRGGLAGRGAFRGRGRRPGDAGRRHHAGLGAAPYAAAGPGHAERGRCAGAGAGMRHSVCVDACPASTLWCWNAPTCRPMRLRCAGPPGCRCWTW